MRGLSWFAIMVKGKWNNYIFYSNTLLDILAVTRNSTSSLHTPGPSSGNYNGQQPYMTGTPCTSCPRGYSCTNDFCVSDGDDSGSGTSSSTGQGQVTNRHRIFNFLLYKWWDKLIVTQKVGVRRSQKTLTT